MEDAATVRLRSEVSELAWERAQLPTCFRCSSASALSLTWVSLRKQRTDRQLTCTRPSRRTICVALNRPLRGAASWRRQQFVAAKADLLLAGVAFDDYAKATAEHEACLVCEASPWAADKRAVEIVRPAPVQSADWVSPKSRARDMAFAKLQSSMLWQQRRRCRLRSSMATCLRSNRLSCSVRADLALARAGRPFTGH